MNKSLIAMVLACCLQGCPTQPEPLLLPDNMIFTAPSFITATTPPTPPTPLEFPNGVHVYNAKNIEVCTRHPNKNWTVARDYTWDDCAEALLRVALSMR